MAAAPFDEWQALIQILWPFCGGHDAAQTIL